MEKQLISISEIAKANGLSSKTIQRIINENPEIGVTMQPRKKTLLTQEQASQVSGLLLKNRRSQKTAENNAELAQSTSQTNNVPVAENSPVVVSAPRNNEIWEMYQKINELTERAARAEGRVEALEEQIEDLKRQREKADDDRAELQAALASNRNLLETAEAKAARAAGDLYTLRAGVKAVAEAGFFSRGKMARELAAAVDSYKLTDGNQEQTER